ncbi:hypothetical protein C4G51_RS18650 [Vibrio parahaemolyticus]|nr:hypothetical protein [Vibrio parahaemolyticus]
MYNYNTVHPAYNNALLSAFGANPSQVNLSEEEKQYLNNINQPSTSIPSTVHPYATSYGGSQQGQLQQQVKDNMVDQLGGYDESSIPIQEQEVINQDYNISLPNGQVKNVVTGQTDIDATAPREKQARGNTLNDTLQIARETGDRELITEQVRDDLVRAGDKNAQFDYQMKNESDAWLEAGLSFGSTLLAAYIAKRMGADDQQFGVMLADGFRRSGVSLQSAYDEIGRQTNIPYLEARGHSKEAILQYKRTGDQKALEESLWNRPFAKSKESSVAYFEKGDPLPNGTIAPRSGNYSVFNTFTEDGTPQVADIQYMGNLEGKRLENDLAIEQLKQGQKVQKAQAEEQADIQSSIQLSQETLQAVDDAIRFGDLAGGDHTGFIDQYTPTFFQDTQRADAAFQRAKNLLTIDNLDLMKGVLTDRDVEILRGAATSMDEKYQWGVNKQELLRVRAKIAQAIADARQGNLPAQRQGVGYAEGQFTTGNDGNRYQFRNGSWYSMEE